MKRLSKSDTIERVYSDIYSDLEKLGFVEVARFVSEFPEEPDFNLAQYGCLRIGYCEVRELFYKAGFSCAVETSKRSPNRGRFKLDDADIWNLYKQHVGQCAGLFIERKGAHYESPVTDLNREYSPASWHVARNSGSCAEDSVKTVTAEEWERLTSVSELNFWEKSGLLFTWLDDVGRVVKLERVSPDLGASTVETFEPAGV